MSVRLGLKLEPLDTLFFRDGRPFAASTRGEGGLPQPRTLTGALRTQIVRQFVSLSRLPELRRSGLSILDALRHLGCPEWVLQLRFRGPWLARCEGQAVEPLVPAPVILSKEGDTRFRLAPLKGQLPGWGGDNALLPLWRAGGADAKPAGGYLSQAGLKTFLVDGLVPEASDLVGVEELYGFDDRTGLAITPDTLTGIDGMLYGIRLLAMKRGVGLYAEVLPGKDAPADLARRFEGAMPFGGEGRHVRVRALAKPCDWPEAQRARKSLWLLASPAPLKQAHRPDNLPAGVAVRAAATAAPMAFSGWDVARNGPEKTRFAVPAGAVYFVEGEFAPEQGSFCADEDASVGWGFALRGTWNDRED